MVRILSLTIVLSLIALFPTRMLAEDREFCGVYCLYIALKSVDLPVESLEKLQEEMGTPPAGGYSLGQIEATARMHGATTLGVDTSLDQLKIRRERFACIAHTHGDHFVILSKIADDGVLVIDPPDRKLVPFATWDREWNGVALLVSPDPLLREEDLRRPLNWRRIVGAVSVVAFIIGFLAVARRHYRVEG